MTTPDDDDRTVSSPKQMPVDDESTRVDPPKKVADDVDDEATQARPPPPQAIAVYKEKQALAKLPVPKKKRMHPLVALGAGLAVLALVLMLLNALRTPSTPADVPEGEEEPGVLHRLFNW
jgi:hypothetical protein